MENTKNEMKTITWSFDDYAEDIIVNDEEYNYLLSLDEGYVGLGDKPLDTLYNEDATKYTLAMFAVKRYGDAWDSIENRLESIDYSKIKHCPYFRIDPERSSVFKYLYDNKIIDDKEYSYYDILGGSLNDKDFWERYIEENNCTSFTDICELVHNAYHGLNNDDIPLVKMDTYVTYLMSKYLKEDEKLDKFIYDHPAFLFSIDKLYELIKNNHFENNIRIFQVIAEIISESNSDEEFEKFWTNYFNIIECNEENVKAFSIKSYEMLLSLINFIDKAPKDKWDILLGLFINSKHTPYLFNTINNKLRDEYLGNILACAEISEYLNDSRMDLVLHYYILGCDVDGYVWTEFIQNPTFAICNLTTNVIVLGNNLYNATEVAKLDIWNNFNDDPDYKYHEMNDFEKSLLKAYDNDMITFKTLMYSLYDMMDVVIDYLIDESEEDDE